MEQDIFHHMTHTCYTHCVELAISIRDMDREYYIGPRWGLGSSTSLNNHLVRVQWKPAGALQWVDKGSTEILTGRKELEFVTKLYFDIQPEDASSIKLNLEFIKGSCGFGVSGGCWASVETDLGRCLASPGSLLLPLALKLGFDQEKFPTYLQDTIQKQYGAPEFVAMADLRTEFVRPQSMERFGMKFCLSFTNDKNTQLDKYSLEFFKMTPTPTTSPYSQCPPFTMLYRQVPTWSTPYFYVNESKLTNGDNERLFQISATKRKSGRRKGFSIFSLDSLLNNGFPPEEKTLFLDLRTADGVQTWPKSGVALRLVQSVYYKTYQDYLRKGLKFVRLYAVDFSESNWDRELHGEILHEAGGSKSMKTPYEEGLELLSALFDSFSAPDSFFYVFGIPNESRDYVGLHQLPGFESEIWEDKFSTDHYNMLMEQYRENANLVTFARLQIEGPPLTNTFGQLSDPSTNYFFPASPLLTMSKKQRNSSSSSTNTTNYFCFPEAKSSPKPKRKAVNRNLLHPLLKDVLALVGAQPTPNSRPQTPQYFTTFVLTDGEFCDVEESAQVIANLSHHPVSVIFIGIGHGDFSQLRRLMEHESYPKLRNNIHMIHFRSFYKWRSALVFYKCRTDPQKVFWKEVTTAVREHAVAYFRVKHPEL